MGAYQLIYLKDYLIRFQPIQIIHEIVIILSLYFGFGRGMPGEMDIDGCALQASCAMIIVFFFLLI